LKIATNEKDVCGAAVIVIHTWGELLDWHPVLVKNSPQIFFDKHGYFFLKLNVLRVRLRVGKIKMMKLE